MKVPSTHQIARISFLSFLVHSTKLEMCLVLVEMCCEKKIHSKFLQTWYEKGEYKISQSFSSKHFFHRVIIAVTTVLIFGIQHNDLIYIFIVK